MSLSFPRREQEPGDGHEGRAEQSGGPHSQRGFIFFLSTVIVHRLGRPPAGFVMIFVGYRFDPE